MSSIQICIDEHCVKDFIIQSENLSTTQHESHTLLKIHEFIELSIPLLEINVQQISEFIPHLSELSRTVQQVLYQSFTYVVSCQKLSMLYADQTRNSQIEVIQDLIDHPSHFEMVTRSSSIGKGLQEIEKYMQKLDDLFATVYLPLEKKKKSILQDETQVKPQQNENNSSWHFEQLNQQEPGPSSPISRAVVRSDSVQSTIMEPNSVATQIQHEDQLAQHRPLKGYRSQSSKQNKSLDQRQLNHFASISEQYMLLRRTQVGEEVGHARIEQQFERKAQIKHETLTHLDGHEYSSQILEPSNNQPQPEENRISEKLPTEHDQFSQFERKDPNIEHQQFEERQSVINTSAPSFKTYSTLNFRQEMAPQRNNSNVMFLQHQDLVERHQPLRGYRSQSSKSNESLDDRLINQFTQISYQYVLLREPQEQNREKREHKKQQSEIKFERKPHNHSDTNENSSEISEIIKMIEPQKPETRAKDNDNGSQEKLPNQDAQKSQSEGLETRDTDQQFKEDQIPNTEKNISSTMNLGQEVVPKSNPQDVALIKEVYPNKIPQSITLEKSFYSLFNMHFNELSPDYLSEPAFDFLLEQNSCNLEGTFDDISKLEEEMNLKRSLWKRMTIAFNQSQTDSLRFSQKAIDFTGCQQLRFLNISFANCMFDNFYILKSIGTLKQLETLTIDVSKTQTNKISGLIEILSPLAKLSNFSFLFQFTPIQKITSLADILRCKSYSFIFKTFHCDARGSRVKNLSKFFASIAKLNLRDLSLNFRYYNYLTIPSSTEITLIDLKMIEHFSSEKIQNFSLDLTSTNTPLFLQKVHQSLSDIKQQLSLCNYEEIPIEEEEMQENQQTIIMPVQHQFVWEKNLLLLSCQYPKLKFQCQNQFSNSQLLKKQKYQDVENLENFLNQVARIKNGDGIIWADQLEQVMMNLSQDSRFPKYYREACKFVFQYSQVNPNLTAQSLNLAEVPGIPYESEIQRRFI